MSYQIRPYHPSDLTLLYHICLLTADHGENAAHMFEDRYLVGHQYIAPYAIFEPRCCFVLTYQATPCGYICGTVDSAVFAQKCEENWFPPLRQRYPLPKQHDHSPDAGVIRAIHKGIPANGALAAYPAHLHLDILPIGQGKGWGSKLMNTLLNQLRKLSVVGVHLGVSLKNKRAIRFYEHTGFKLVKKGSSSIVMGLSLR